MPDYRHRPCRLCGVEPSETVSISWRGLCRTCAIERTAANATQVSEGRGPLAEHRLRRQLMAAQRGLIALEREQG